MLAPVCALAFTLWADRVRLQRVEFISKAATKDALVDPYSPTGYADGKRWLIVPEHDNPTYQWIEETQLMLARGDWRVRSVGYENAPFGRGVHSASPYRWWLVLLAWSGRAVSGQPLGLCVERAALYADPLLHLLLLVAATVFVARRFGPFCAALLSLGLAAIFPLASAFLPGVANDFGLEQICTLWGVLLLVAGTLAGRHASRWFFAGGVAGGCGLWLSAMGQVPVLAGIAGGGILAALQARGGPKEPSAEGSTLLPWRAWAFGGAASSLLAYLVEYFPGHMEPQLRVNYPLYGLAWLGLGELLWRLESWIRGGRPFGGLRGVGMWILSAAAVASLPVAILRSGDRAFLADDMLSTRLTNLPDGVAAAGLSAWIGRDGPWGSFAAACLPLLLLGPAAWFLFRGRTGAVHRRAIAIALGPALAALALAIQRLRWWNTLDVALLALLVAAAAAVHTAVNPRGSRWLWSALLGAVLAFGLVQLVPSAGSGGPRVIRLTRAEVEGLYERALSQWIADHAGPDGATVLAPPFRTSSLCFYGGLRGLGTQNWENGDGLSAAFHIVSSMRQDESLSVIRQRGVTHIVLPSWDTDLEEFARLNLKYPEASFVYALHGTGGGGFNWLRPLPYEVPPVAGLEQQSVLVLEVTDRTDPATLQGRFVEYLVEMHRIDRAAVASGELLRYPADLGSLVALAQLAKARGDDEAFAKVFRSIVSGVTGGSDRRLIWDRRVSLAVVLALGGRSDLSRAQVKRCVGEADEARIRFLTTESLYHLLLLAKRSGTEISDPGLHSLSLKLLPEELRGRL
jgi:hypothetical protein